MFIRLVIVLLGLAAVIGGIFGWKSYQAEQQAAFLSQPAPPAVVSATKVSEERWHRRLSAVGSLAAIQGIDVTTEVSGLVTALHFDSGESVEKGDLLVELDTSVDMAELQELQAARDLAQTEFDRVKKLLETGDTPQSAYDSARAQLASAKARVEAKEALIAKKKIRAAFSGRLGLRQIDIGDYLDSGDAVAPLQVISPIYADFSLPEHFLPHIAKGHLVNVTVRSFPERTFQGRVLATDPGIDPDNRNFRVRALFDNGEELLRPGMFAEIDVVLPEERLVLAVPDTAIAYNTYGDSVFVVAPDETGDLIVLPRQVITGEVRDGKVEILAGLEPGQTVVTAGHVKLRNGQRVTIDNSIELRPEMVNLQPDIQFRR